MKQVPNEDKAASTLSIRRRTIDDHVHDTTVDFLSVVRAGRICDDEGKDDWRKRGNDVDEGDLALPRRRRLIPHIGLRKHKGQQIVWIVISDNLQRPQGP